MSVRCRHGGSGVLGKDDALACGQAVGLHDERIGRLGGEQIA
jgi:hypothetical protein